MNFTWITYALKVTAIFNMCIGVFGLAVENYNLALGNFVFSLILLMSALLANEFYGRTNNAQTAQIKKKNGQLFDD